MVRALRRHRRGHWFKSNIAHHFLIYYFKCYQKLEDDIAFIQKHGLAEFRRSQKAREKLLWKLLDGFNEGRSKSYFCLAATVLDLDELAEAVKEAAGSSKSLDIKEKAKLAHSILDRIAEKKGYYLKLRKKPAVKV